MTPEIIFETERLLVRKLIMSDIEAFHEMQSNPNVMQYADGEVKSMEDHETELNDLISMYEKEENDFWIYAIERKSDHTFVGTVAFIKDENNDDEIGFRFLEKYWGLGYGFEIGKGMVFYSKSVGIPKLIGYVMDANIASAKILQKLDFKATEKTAEPKSQLPETKYELEL